MVNLPTLLIAEEKILHRFFFFFIMIQLRNSKITAVSHTIIMIQWREHSKTKSHYLGKLWEKRGESVMHAT